MFDELFGRQHSSHQSSRYWQEQHNKSNAEQAVQRQIDALKRRIEKLEREQQ